MTPDDLPSIDLAPAHDPGQDAQRRENGVEAAGQLLEVASVVGEGAAATAEVAVTAASATAEAVGNIAGGLVEGLGAAADGCSGCSCLLLLGGVVLTAGTAAAAVVFR